MALPAVANDVFVLNVVNIVFILTLATCGAEETFFALATATLARGIMRIVDTAQIAAYLATSTWNACLVDTFMLWARLCCRSRAVTPDVVTSIVIDIVAVAVGVVVTKVTVTRTI